MSGRNDFTYLRRVVFGTGDGLYALTLSAAYLVAGLTLLLHPGPTLVWIGNSTDIAGVFAMPLLLLLVHVWHRSGVPIGKRLHVPSIVGVSAFALLVPLIWLGVL